MLTRSLWLLLFTVTLIGTSLAEAQSVFYVRSGANGSNNGSSWTDAYTALPKTLQRGATYYIADGTYGPYIFNDAESGTKLITIKKATIADHGSATGWLNSYGDGQAYFVGAQDRVLNFTTGYWTFDGNGAIGTYGFKASTLVGDPSPPPGYRVVSVGVSIPNVLNNITIRSIEIDGRDVPFVDGFGLNKVNNFLLSNYEVHHLEDDAVEGCHPCTNSIIEYGYHHDSHGGPSGVSRPDAYDIYQFSNFTWRYNYIVHHSQMLFFSSSKLVGRADVYGNVFVNTNGGTGSKCINARSTVVMGPLYIYNNTCAGTNDGFVFSSLHTGVAKNNLFYNISRTFTFGGLAHSHNWYFNTPIINEPTKQTGVGSPFVSFPTNLRLKAATLSGDTGIGAAYRIDDLNDAGITRGADGVWDRGAFEYTKN